jgi:hypothetical protein
VIEQQRKKHEEYLWDKPCGQRIQLAETFWPGDNSGPSQSRAQAGPHCNTKKNIGILYIFSKHLKAFFSFDIMSVMKMCTVVLEGA